MPTSVLDQATEQIKGVRGKALVDQQREKPALWERAQELMTEARGENRPMSADERARYDDLTGLISEINEREQDEKKNADMDRRFAEVKRPDAAYPREEDEQTQRATDKKAYRQAFNTYLRNGHADLDPEQRKMLRNGQAPTELRALGTMPGASGGFLIPTTTQAMIVESLKFFGGMDRVGQHLDTDTGQPIEYPTNDDTANVGALIAENTAATSLDLSFGQKKLDAFLFSSRIVLVPITLLQDAAVDIEAFIARKMGQRLGRIYNTYQTTGLGGGNQPQGLITGVTVGKTFAGAAAITYNELIDLEHSVDYAYRQSWPVVNGGDGDAPNADFVGYMFNDSSVFAALRKLADSQSRPLWIPWLGQGVAGAVPATFNGWNYIINNDMASLATTNKTVAFGNFSEAIIIRKVQGISIVRLEERYAEFGQVNS